MSEEKPTTSEERPHAFRSSSSLGTIALCEGYVSQQTKSVHWVTAQGLRGHDALENDDKGELESSFEERMVQSCEDYVARLPPGWDVDEPRDVKEPRIETIPHPNGKPRWGYADRLRVCYRVVPGTEGSDPHREPTGEAHLVDYKFVKAKEVPDAEINMQGKDYVVGIFEHPKYEFLESIKVHFPMPRFGSVTTATFRRSDVPRLKLEIFALLRKASRSDHGNYRGKTLTPNYDACRFCKHSGTCVALRGIAKGIRDQYAPDGEGDLSELPEFTHASDQHLTPAQRGHLQRLAGVMEAWARSVKFHNSQAALNDPDAVEGFAPDTQKGRRVVTNPSALLMVASEFGLSADDLIQSSALAFGKVETLIKATAQRGEKGKRVKAFDNRLREFDAIEDGPDTPILSRVAVKADA